MNYVIAIWIVWAVLGLILLGLILYRVNITKDEEDRLFLDNGSDAQHRQQDEMLRKLKRVEPVIRVCGGAEGLVTLGIVAFYLMDALRQF